ncbi:MAG: hypothetical protein J5806_06500 [Lentisphaeria bacterium]|nr:hypothetical protein [Lentisphaeria bacterium]
MTVMVFPAKATTMRLTNQRLVFCDVSRALTLGVSWLFWFKSAATISQSFTRAEIVDAHLEMVAFGREKISITNIRGETFQYCGSGFNNNAVHAIMEWYNNPPA